MEVNMFFQMLVDFNGLHGIISLTTELFIPTAVRTSNPLNSPNYLPHLHLWLLLSDLQCKQQNSKDTLIWINTIQDFISNLDDSKESSVSTLPELSMYRLIKANVIFRQYKDQNSAFKALSMLLILKIGGGGQLTALCGTVM
jgi:hypothetical protein